MQVKILPAVKPGIKAGVKVVDPVLNNIATGFMLRTIWENSEEAMKKALGAEAERLSSCPASDLPELIETPDLIWRKELYKLLDFYGSHVSPRPPSPLKTSDAVVTVMEGYLKQVKVPARSAPDSVKFAALEPQELTELAQAILDANVLQNCGIPGFIDDEMTLKSLSRHLKNAQEVLRRSPPEAPETEFRAATDSEVPDDPRIHGMAKTLLLASIRYTSGKDAKGHELVTHPLCKQTGLSPHALRILENTPSHMPARVREHYIALSGRSVESLDSITAQMTGTITTQLTSLAKEIQHSIPRDRSKPLFVDLSAALAKAQPGHLILLERALSEILINEKILKESRIVTIDHSDHFGNGGTVWNCVVNAQCEAQKAIIGR